MLNNLILKIKPAVMGILNVTPDSFSDGGHYYDFDQAIKRGIQIAQEGAHIIDVGGESTRPNSTPVPLQQELDRVIPVIEKLSQEIDIPISVDTYKPAVMQAAIQAGATFINDIKALQEPGALSAVRESGAFVCLMHMQGNPLNMQRQPTYKDVISEVCDFLLARKQACINAGIAREKIMIDPGFGFGKTVDHNLLLLKNLERLHAIDCPILVSLSRKSFIGALLQQPVPENRLGGSIAAAVVAAIKGAAMMRTHDVKSTVEALRFTSLLSA